MGAIRVKVLLTNATDEELHRMRKLPAKKIRRCEVDALVDAGAVRSVVPAHILKKLGVGIRGIKGVEYADGRKEEVAMSAAIVFEVMGRDTVEDAYVLGNEVLLNQTFLESTDFHADARNQRLIPNPEHPDFPVLMLKRVAGSH